MSLNETAVYTTSLDWWVANARRLERELIVALETLEAANAELARFEPVTVSTSTTPHTLNIRRADGATDWVDNGVTLYVKAEQ